MMELDMGVESYAVIFNYIRFSTTWWILNIIFYRKCFYKKKIIENYWNIYNSLNNNMN